MPIFGGTQQKVIVKINTFLIIFMTTGSDQGPGHDLHHQLQEELPGEADSPVALQVKSTCFIREGKIKIKKPNLIFL